MANRILAALAVLFLLSATILAQSVISPARADGLVARGGGAVIIGDTFAREHSVAESFYPTLPTELNGVSATIDSLPVGIFVVFETSIHIVIPIDLHIAPREGPKMLHLTTPLGEWWIPVRVSRSAPGWVENGEGGLAGIWTMTGEDFHYLNEPVQINRSGSGLTWLLLWTSGTRAARRPTSRSNPYPFAPWFVDDLYLWIGDRKLPAMFVEGGLPGIDRVGAYLPLDLPAGKYELRVEAGRVKSEPLPIVVW